jgi:hypothetical protein
MDEIDVPTVLLFAVSFAFGVYVSFSPAAGHLRGRI